MVDLAMSIFEFLTKFLVIWHPWHPWVCIRSDLKPLETDISDSSYCVKYPGFAMIRGRDNNNKPKEATKIGKNMKNKVPLDPWKLFLETDPQFLGCVPSC